MTQQELFQLQNLMAKAHAVFQEQAGRSLSSFGVGTDTTSQNEEVYYLFGSDVMTVNGHETKFVFSPECELESRSDHSIY